MMKKEPGKLYIEEDGQSIAELIYTDEEDYYDVTGTYTVPEQRNRGLAKDLVNEIVAMARENNKKIKPTCPYVPHAIRGSEYDDIRM